MPAVDVLNITCNEGDIRKKDVSLAFAGAFIFDTLSR
jgi:hypothetical protein